MGIKAESDVQRHEPRYAFSERQCDICPNKFKPKSPQHKHCCRRCAFIAVKLGRPAAKHMDRDVAITFYGSQYDDPLRHVRRGTTKQLIRLIMGYCAERDTEFVTKQNVEEYANISLKDNAMDAAVGATPALTHFVKTVDDNGASRVVYQFIVEDLITNRDAMAQNVKRYPARDRYVKRYPKR